MRWLRQHEIKSVLFRPIDARPSIILACPSVAIYTPFFSGIQRRSLEPTAAYEGYATGGIPTTQPSMQGDCKGKGEQAAVGEAGARGNERGKMQDIVFWVSCSLVLSQNPIIERMLWWTVAVRSHTRQNQLMATLFYDWHTTIHTQ